MQKLFYISLLSLTFFVACQKPEKEQEEIKLQPQPYQLQVPAHFPKLPPMPEHNLLTVQGVELGKALFYDPVLSANNTVSCASCHQQNLAFTDAQALSTLGTSGKKLNRHSPALINLAWMDGLFWDGGAKNLESLSFAPLTHPDEMAQDLNELESELQNHPKYPKMFKEAFGIDKIQSAYVVRALAQFQRTLISANSAYDDYLNGNKSALNSEQLQGLTLFQEHCSSCHSGPLLTDNSYHNNGLDNQFSLDHERIAWGRGRITDSESDIGKYKTPTLRNIAITAPYMHDGRFNTLNEVLNHYQKGMVFYETLDSAFTKTEGQPGLAISDADKHKIIAFLQTLTDHGFIHNKEFAE